MMANIGWCGVAVVMVVVVVVVVVVVIVISMYGLHYPPTIISCIGKPRQDHSWVELSPENE